MSFSRQAKYFQVNFGEKVVLNRVLRLPLTGALYKTCTDLYTNHYSREKMTKLIDGVNIEYLKLLLDNDLRFNVQLVNVMDKSIPGGYTVDDLKTVKSIHWPKLEGHFPLFSVVDSNNSPITIHLHLLGQILSDGWKWKLGNSKMSVFTKKKKILILENNVARKATKEESIIYAG
jgi:hypothetical protein